MPKTLFFAATEGLEIAEPLGRGDRFRDIYFITNDRDEIARRVTPHAPSIGHIELNALLDGRPVVICDDDLPVLNDESAGALLVDRLVQTGHMLRQLWHIRDNSVDTEMGYLVWEPQAVGPIVTRNFFGSIMTTARGSRGPTCFSRDELKKARHLVTWNSDVKYINQPHAISVPRAIRADYFVQAARAEGDLGLKIAMYATAFEALLATDTTELSHRLAERAAWLLEDDPGERSVLYKKIKAAYGMRSKVVHGAKGALKESELVESSEFCDSLARRLLGAAYNIPELRAVFLEEKTPVDDFLTRLLFGGWQRQA